MSTILLQTAKSSWPKPASTPVSFRWQDHMYKVQEPEASFLFSYPKPNSMVVSALSKSRKTHSTTSDKERKKQDMFGRHFYKVGTLGFCSTTYSAFMGRYQCYLWDQLTHIFGSLQAEVRERAHWLQKESMALAKQQLTAAWHSLDTYAKTVTLAVALHCHLELRSSTFPYNTRAYIEDLPFDGDGLFSSSTNLVLQDVDKSTKTSRTLSISSQSRSDPVLEVNNPTTSCKILPGDLINISRSSALHILGSPGIQPWRLLRENLWRDRNRAFDSLQLMFYESPLLSPTHLQPFLPAWCRIT